jgi:hypothetical protein
VIEALHVANFKAFGASQRIPLRPITLIFGANSAGKSSLLHAIALAHHAIETGELDTQRTQIGGDSIDLGGFRQYVHRRQRERQVELAFELDPGRLTGRVAELLRSARAVTVQVAIGAGRASEPARSDGGSIGQTDGDGVRVERFGLEVNGSSLLSMSARPGGLLRLDRLDHGHPVFRDVYRAIVTLATTTQDVQEKDFAALGDVLDRLVPGIGGRPRGLFPRIEEEPEAQDAERQAALFPVSRGRRQEDLALAARLFLPGALRDLIGGLANVLESEIRSLRYLGPLRSYPPRHLAFSQHHDPNWFAGGGHAWDIVRKDEEVRRRVNAWLGDATRLKTPYTLEVRDLLPAAALSVELPPKLAKALYRWVAALVGQEDLAKVVNDLATGQGVMVDPAAAEEVLPEIEDLVSATTDTDAMGKQWVREFVESRPEVLQDLVLIDQRTGTVVSHRDVGIGVSQVLPVLVSAYSENAKLLAIEQPEIHLHPALQAELGDVFLASALRDHGNRFLIETHSEHLILRILRRIRETTDGQPAPGVPPVRPDDVCVLYVQPGKEGAEVIHIPVTDEGEFEQPWPDGFFPERARELF